MAHTFDVKIVKKNIYWVNNIKAEDEEEACKIANRLMDKNGREEYFDDQDQVEEAWCTSD